MIQLTHVRAAAADPMAPAGACLPSLHDFTLWLGRGEAWAVLGEPGAGKTALLGVVAGRVTPQSGTCTVQGSVAAAMQEDGLIAKRSGEQNAKQMCRRMGYNTQRTNAYIASVKQRFGMDEAFSKPVAGYDAGQRARLMMCMALAQNPDVLVVANVLERCDAAFRQACEQEILKRLNAGMTLLMQSRDAGLQRRLCQSALWLTHGRLHRLGPYETVYAAYAYPAALKAYTDVKRMLQNTQVAFAQELAPDTGEYPVNWPEQARRALAEAHMRNERLNAQLTAYAQANLAFERENERLTAAAQSQEARLKDGERMLGRMAAVCSDTLQLMHAQFLHLRQLHTQPRKK